MIPELTSEIISSRMSFGFLDRSLPLTYGTLHVFDTSTFTMGGEPVTSWFALDTDGDWAPDSEEAIADGYFHESEVISAPYFSIRIDGINELTNE